MWLSQRSAWQEYVKLQLCQSVKTLHLFFKNLLIGKYYWQQKKDMKYSRKKYNLKDKLQYIKGEKFLK